MKEAALAKSCTIKKEKKSLQDGLRPILEKETATANEQQKINHNTTLTFTCTLSNPSNRVQGQGSRVKGQGSIGGLHGISPGVEGPKSVFSGLF